MKSLKIFVAVLAVLGVVTYITLFTGIGNSLLRPIVESRISTALGMPVQLKKFYVGMSDLDVVLYLTNRNGIHIYGNYSLFSQNLDLKYDVKLLNLAELQTLTKRSLAGELKTQGSIKGDLGLLKVEGKSDVAKSDTRYHIELTDFDVSSITAKIKSLQIDALLAMLQEPKYAYATLDLDLDFKNIKPHQLDGTVHLETKKGHFVSAVVRKELGVTIPHTRFVMEADAKLQKETLTYNSVFDSNLVKFKTSGKVVPEPLKTDIAYKASIKELALLKPLIHADLRGGLNVEGTLKGEKEKMLLKLVSDLAESETTVLLTLKEFQPSALQAKVLHLKLGKLFYMLKQPRYALGEFNLQTDIKNFKAGSMQGKVTTLATGALNGAYLTKAYKFKHPMPKTPFRLRSISKLDGSKVDTLATLASGLANIRIDKAVFDVLDGTLQSDYAINLPSLENLSFITDRKLRGSLDLHGKIQGDQEKMNVRIDTDAASSKTEVLLTLHKLQPSALEANISDMRLEKLLYMLNEPRYAKGELNLKAEMKSLKSDSLKGKVTTYASGTLDGASLKKLLGLKQPVPKTNFEFHSDSSLKGSKIATAATLSSNLANVRINKALFETNDATLESDYQVEIPSLENLYFLTKRDLRGDITAEGKIYKAKEIRLTLRSNVAGGALKLDMKGNKVHADLNDMRTKKLLWMLRYPEIFDGGMYAKVDYDLGADKGFATADFKDGKFVKNHVFDLLKQFGKVDLYREYFNGNAKANINKEKIAAAFDLKARKAEIKSRKTLLDTKRSKIDSVLDIRVENTPVVVTLKGDIAKPKVGVDLQAFMKSEVGRKLEKKADKELKRFLKKLF